MKPSTFALAVVALLAPSACAAQRPQGPAAHDAPAPPAKAAVVLEEFASGLEFPWGLAFLPDGRALVTERAGRLRFVDPQGKVSAPIGGVPAVFDEGQGGLLGLAIDPDFASNGLIYFAFAEPDPKDARLAGTALARARLDGDRLTDVDILFRQTPKLNSGLHFGGRVVVAKDGTLFLTTGERYRRDRAQELTGHLGKVIRITREGGAPPDNPFVGRNDARPEIWSYGHRNLQGAALHPETGALWTHEHGAQGGDEINIPQAGKNYGWPIITYGIDYSGLPIGEGAAKQGLAQPLYYWNPSIAPSGMAFYDGAAIPQWRGDLLVGSLKFGFVERLDLDGDQVIGSERLFEAEIQDRVRDVVVGPDGWVYVLTDNPDGRILRIRPR